MRRPSFLDVRFDLSKLTSQLGIDEITGVFLPACNFTDAWSLSLNSRRVFMARMDFGHITFLVMEYLIRLSYLLP